MMAKYWEEEDAEIIQVGKNEFRLYKDACKLQIFPIVKHAPRGVGKGTVIDLEVMDADELYILETTFAAAVQSMRERLS